MGTDTAAVARHHGELSSLNALFIDLVVALARRDEPAPVLGLPRPLARGLQSLPADTLDRLASRPFALFCLGFHEHDRWRSRLRRGTGDAAARSTGNEAVGELGAFTLVALTTARQFARLDPYEAALRFGMDTGLARRLGAVELAALPVLASLAAPGLSARQAGNPVFWPGLLAACHGSGINGADTALAMGVQLTLVDALNLAGSRTPPQRPYRVHGPPSRLP